MYHKAKSGTHDKMERKNRIVCMAAALFFAAGFLLCLCYPKPEYSYSERRSLAVMPQFSGAQVWSGRFMSEFEDYASDTFPMRDSLRTLKALASERLFFRQDNNGLYAADGFICDMEYPVREDSLNHAVSRFRYICGKYLPEADKVFLSVIPDKNCFLAPQSGHLSMDYAEFEKQMAKKADFAKYIRISDLLDKDDYYKTDTHWKQEKITDVAQRLAREMGTVLPKDYNTHTLTTRFYGVYYGQAALPLPPDTLKYLTGESMNSCHVYDWQNGAKIPVYNMEKAAGKDPYEIFLSGPLSLVTIENTQAQTDKQLVIFRDSFASSLAPLLISGFSKITLADIRYIHPDTLGKLIDFKDCDVLFLYSTLVLNHSEQLK